MKDTILSFECIGYIVFGVFAIVLLPFAILFDLFTFIKWMIHSHRGEIEKDTIV